MRARSDGWSQREAHRDSPAPWNCVKKGLNLLNNCSTSVGSTAAAADSWIPTGDQWSSDARVTQVEHQSSMTTA